MTRIIILGGGFGGLETYQQIHRLCHPCDQNKIAITLINRNNYLTFTPMLHEAATGSVSREHVVQPIRELMVCCQNVFHQEEILNIDFARQQVTTDQQKHQYDLLVISLGARSYFFNIPGAREHALPLKTMSDAINIRNRIISSFERASASFARGNHKALKQQLNFVIIGGGTTGVELAGQLADLIHGDIKLLYPDVPAHQAHVFLVHSDVKLLNKLPVQASIKAQRRLEKLGVRILLRQSVQSVASDHVRLLTGKKIITDNIFWTAGTRSSLTSLIDNHFLDHHQQLLTDKFRRVKSAPNVFALGDNAVVEEADYATPATAQAAVWEAKLVAENIFKQIKHKPLSARRYRSRGDIIPIGDWYGIFVRPHFIFSGRLAWLLRRAAFLQTMYGWGDRLRVLSDWIIDIFLPRDTSRF